MEVIHSEQFYLSDGSYSSEMEVMGKKLKASAFA